MNLGGGGGYIMIVTASVIWRSRGSRDERARPREEWVVGPVCAAGA